MKNVFIKCEEIVKVHQNYGKNQQKKPDHTEPNSVSRTSLKSRS